MSGRRFRRIARVSGASLVVLCLAALFCGVGLYFLMRGEAIENSIVNSRIHASIQQMLGPEFDLDMGRTTVGFDSGGLLALDSRDVRIRKRTDDDIVSELGRISVGIKLSSLLFGNPQVNSVTVADSTLNAGALVLPVGDAQVMPETVDEAVTILGDQLEKLRLRMREADFRKVELHNVELTGLPNWRKAKGPINITEFRLRRAGKTGLSLTGKMESQHSDISLTGEYRSGGAGSGTLALEMDGLSLLEWGEPYAAEIGPLGSASAIALSANVPLGSKADTDDPRITLKVSPGPLRIGRNGRTDLKELTLNIRAMREKNQIELEPSTLAAGQFTTRLVGGAKPADGSNGFSGDWRFELIGDPASGTPTTTGEERVQAAMVASGYFLADDLVIEADRVEMRAGEDRLHGSASIGLRGQTPSLTADLRAAKIEMAALRQLWPFWIAPPVRQWIHQNAFGGEVSDFKLTTNVPPGIIGRFRQGAKMAPDEFHLTMKFEDVRISTFGALPAIRKARGSFDMTGMKAQLDLADGQVYLGDDETVEVTGGKFTVEDVGKRPNDSEVQVSLEGPARSMARIVDFDPINAMRKMKIDPASVKGKSHLNVVVRIPLRRQLAAEDVDWHAMVSLEKAGSGDKIFGRQIADADLNIEVTPRAARISGTAEVDGTSTKLEMTEPIGQSNIGSVRNFSAVLDNEARRKMGLTLDTIIDGDVQVQVDQIDKNSQLQKLDLTNATLTLPWIGWSKGKSIPANASYIMRQADGRTKLDNFYIEGEGFSAAGSLMFDKSGLLSADFADISLNEGDSFALKLDRSGNTYNIEVAGVRMDARGLINKLFHQGGFGDAQGDANISLTANLGQVRGFNNRVVRGVNLRYGTREGWFDSLSLRGTFTDQTYVNIFATTEERATTFEIDSNDAGATLGFTDVYRRMDGGDLRAKLVRQQGGAFAGPVSATNFVVADEPRLKSIISNPGAGQLDRGQSSLGEVQRQLSAVNTQRITFLEARADIEKGENYFRVSDGVINSAQIGFTFDGLLYDEQKHMDLSGTFLPAMAISRAIGFIPLVGEILGNGRDSGLIGITFRMRGPSRNPTVEVNPISVVAPGVFRKVFEYRN